MEKDHRKIDIHTGEKSFPIQMGAQEKATIINILDGSIYSVAALPHVDEKDIEFVDVIFTELDEKPNLVKINEWESGELNTDELDNIPVILRFKDIGSIDRLINILYKQRNNLRELKEINFINRMEEKQS